MGNKSSSELGDVYKLVDDGALDELEDILRSDPDEIDLLNEDGETLLFRACSNGNANVVALLLSSGADLSIPCDDISVLHVAAAAHSPKTVQLLIEKGADAKAVTLDQTTPLHCAIQYGDFIAAKLLIEAGADVLAKNKHGKTPFEMEVETEAELEVDPLTEAQIGILHAIANKKRGQTTDSDLQEDIETMRQWFREAGLGVLESREASKLAVENLGAKTGKKLAFLTHSGKISLESLGLSQDDRDLVYLALKNSLPSLFNSSKSSSK
jgi:hypothetical protein